MVSYSSFVVLLAALTSVIHCAIFDKWPKECEGKQICFTKPKQFPQPSKEVIAAVLKSENKTKAQVRIARDTAAESSSSEEPIVTCEAIKVRQKLYMARASTMDDWKMVVQNDNFEQMVQVTHCVKDKSTCTFQSYLPAGIQTRCVTKYTNLSLVVFDPKTNTTDSNFVVSHPVACACELFPS